MKWSYHPGESSLSNKLYVFVEGLKEYLPILVFFAAECAAVIVYSKFKLPCICLWLALPVFAHYVRKGILDDHLTSKGLRAVSLCAVLGAFILSVLIFVDGDLQMKIGHYLVKGAKFWPAEGPDSYGGSMDYIAHSAPTWWGRLILNAYNPLIVLMSVIGCCNLGFAFGSATKRKDKAKAENDRLE